MVSPGFLPIIPQRIGAIDPFVYDLSYSLSNLNNVHLVGTGNGKQKTGNLYVETVDYRLIFPRPLFDIPLFGKLIGTLSFQLPYSINIFKRFTVLNKAEQFDILHIHDINSGFIATSIKKVYGTPWVCSIHNAINFDAPIRYCDKVLPVSNYLRNLLIDRYSLDKRDVEVLNLAVDTQRLERKHNILEAKLKLGFSNRRIVLFVGRKCPQKGPQVLMDALPRILRSNPEALAVFVGPDYLFGSSSNKYTEFLRNKAKNLNIDSATRFFDFIPDDTLHLFYEAADVVVFPSIWQEPCGKVILEAMCFETPVIASAVGGIPELILNGKNGVLVEPADPDCLAAAVNSVLIDSEYARRLGKDGRESVLNKYTFTQVATRCLEIYQSVIQKA